MAGAAAASAASNKGTVRFEHPTDSSKWGNAHLTTGGALQLTASKCVDTSNFCGRYASTTECTSNAAVVSKVVFRTTGSEAEARMQLCAQVWACSTPLMLTTLPEEELVQLANVVSSMLIEP